MMQIKQLLKGNKRLKAFIHWLLIPKGEAYPRWWVRIFVNPWVHKKERGSKVRATCRMDVVPFNQFTLGKLSVVEDFCTVNNGVGDVLIGRYTLVGISSVLIGPVSIGDNVIIAQNVVISGLNHEYTDIKVPIRKQKVNTSRITIDDDCWIGANAVITAGVRIGKHSVVGAGAVVTKDVPPYSVIVGNPAKIIKTYDFNSRKWGRVPNPA